MTTPIRNGIAISLCLLCLTACISPEQQRANAEAAQRGAAQYEQNRLMSFQKRCVAYGFRPGTPQMAQCVQQADEADRAEQQMIIMNNRGTPGDPNYWFNKSKCSFSGRSDC